MWFPLVAVHFTAWPRLIDTFDGLHLVPAPSIVVIACATPVVASAMAPAIASAISTLAGCILMTASLDGLWGYYARGRRPDARGARVVRIGRSRRGRLAFPAFACGTAGDVECRDGARARGHNRSR